MAVCDGERHTCDSRSARLAGAAQRRNMLSKKLLQRRNRPVSYRKAVLSQWRDSGALNIVPTIRGLKGAQAFFIFMQKLGKMS